MSVRGHLPKECFAKASLNDAQTLSKKQLY